MEVFLFKKELIMKPIKFSILFIIILLSTTLFAGNGMWIPLLLKKNNIDDMHSKGLKLSAEDIYSINHSSLKDAIVQFGGGCTAELISNEGLLITNHHCGYGSIQKHSSVEHDYLTDGFWAMNKSEELPNEGLTVSFLVMMKDVTKLVVKDLKEGISETEREKLIAAAIKSIQKTISDSSLYTSEIKPFYYGNEYYLFVYEVFKDVRLVGTPPSSIGKFGGDTDNWMWPRHTGDFSMFRIYANKDNKPAEYSIDNVPYHPKKSLSININGIKENDFTMVYGYPGRTQEYLTSDAVRYIVEDRNPARIKLRDKKLLIMRQEMKKSDKVRIQLSSKYAHVANGWKKWIGEKKGLEKLDAIDVKIEQERLLQNWIEKEVDREHEYGNLLREYKQISKKTNQLALAQEYVFESVFGVELISFASKLKSLSTLSGDKLENKILDLKRNARSFYKDYDVMTDQKVMEALYKIYYQDQTEEFQPSFFREIEKKYKGDFLKFSENVFSKSIFTNEEKYNQFLNKYSDKNLLKDPIYKIYNSTLDFYYNTIYPVLSVENSKKTVLNRKYMKALLAFNKDKTLFADANFTLRLSYGKVEGFQPKDGVDYKYFTSLKGVMEKGQVGKYDYIVEPKLKELYENKDYGIYGEDSTMHVCFSASNHTTGGNSGSPVLNNKGQLIGVNFDRNWEGTMSDIMYDPDQCRNISLDIRYALFIIDKYAGAGYLINEMDIVKN